MRSSLSYPLFCFYQGLIDLALEVFFLMAKKDIKVVLNCSFCKKSQHEVKKLVAGPSVYVCNECIKLCNKILEEDQQAKEQKEALNLPTPHAIKAFLDQYVIAQDEAKKV